MPSPRIQLGLERCLADPPAVLGRCRFGLLMNQASVDARFRYAHELLAEAFPGRLVALFSPQHGPWSTEQDNMIETPHGEETSRRLPIHSLYAETREPDDRMLEGIECLVVDLQDVGARVYTFIWTISCCLEACGRRSIPVVVLDRPNPLGGLRVEGKRLDPAYASFVGRAPIPMVHGLTVGEMALHLNRCLGCEADVTVVSMNGWRRGMYFPETGRSWVPPSPNLPRIEGVRLYPGAVLLEGTELSEGRGTTTPFEVAGAPDVDPHALRSVFEAWHLPGVAARPIWFRPTFQKWCNEPCGGLFLHVTDESRFRPYRTGLVLLDCLRRVLPATFRWRPPPYEYESERMPIDILSGGSQVRGAIERGLSPSTLEDLAGVDEAAWWREVRGSLLYE